MCWRFYRLSFLKMLILKIFELYNHIWTISYMKINIFHKIYKSICYAGIAFHIIVWKCWYNWLRNEFTGFILHENKWISLTYNRFEWIRPIWGGWWLISRAVDISASTNLQMNIFNFLQVRIDVPDMGGQLHTHPSLAKLQTAQIHM